MVRFKSFWILYLVLSTLLGSCGKTGSSNEGENDSTALPVDSIDSSSQLQKEFAYKWNITPFDIVDSTEIPEEWLIAGSDVSKFEDAGLVDNANKAFNTFCGMQFGGYEGVLQDEEEPVGEWVNLFGRDSEDRRLAKSLVISFLRDPETLKPIITFNGRVLNIWRIVENKVYYSQERPFVSLQEYLSEYNSPDHVRKMIMDGDTQYKSEYYYEFNDPPFEVSTLNMNPIIERAIWKDNFAYVTIHGFDGHFYLNNKADYDYMKEHEAEIGEFSNSINNSEYERTVKLTSTRLVRDDIIVPGNPEMSAALSNATMRNEVVDCGERTDHYEVLDGGNSVLYNGEPNYNHVLFQLINPDEMVTTFFYKKGKQVTPGFMTYKKINGVWHYRDQRYKRIN